MGCDLPLKQLGPVVVRGLARAWVNFTGSGTVAIKDDENVASITDEGNGDYTINIETDFANANYCYVGTARDTATNTNLNGRGGTSPTAGSLRILCRTLSGGALDPEDVCVAFFGEMG